MFFPDEKILIQGNWAIVGWKMIVLSCLWIRWNNFLKILHKERGEKVHENYINGSPKKFSGANGPFLGLKMVHIYNSWSALRIFFNFAETERSRCTSKLSQWFFKKKYHSGKGGHYGPKTNVLS